MGQHILGFVAPFGKEGGERIGFGIRQGPAYPAALVSRKECEGVCADVFGIEYGVAYAAGGAHMGADVFCHGGIGYYYCPLKILPHAPKALSRIWFWISCLHVISEEMGCWNKSSMTTSHSLLVQ